MGKFLSESGLKTLWNRITTSFLTSGATNATSATIDTLASKIPSTETIDESTSYIPVITKQGNNGANSVTASTIPYSKVTENVVKSVNNATPDENGNIELEQGFEVEEKEDAFILKSVVPTPSQNYTKAETDAKLSLKQDKLKAGANINIADDGTISSTGEAKSINDLTDGERVETLEREVGKKVDTISMGGVDYKPTNGKVTLPSGGSGGGGVVDLALDANSTNAIANKVVTNVIDGDIVAVTKEITDYGWERGRISKSDGTTMASSSSQISKLLSASAIDSITYSATLNATYDAGLAFYDASEKPILPTYFTNGSVTDALVDSIPSNAVYFRVMTRKESDTSLRVSQSIPSLKQLKREIDMIEGKAYHYEEKMVIPCSANILTTPELAEGWTYADGVYTHLEGYDAPMVYDFTTKDKRYLCKIVSDSNGSASVIGVNENALNVCIGDKPTSDVYNGQSYIYIGLISDGGAFKVIPDPAYKGRMQAELYEIVDESEATQHITLQNYNNIYNNRPKNDISSWWTLAMGAYALESSENATRCNAIGYKAMQSLVSGGRNVAIGTFTMPFVTKANRNVVIGADALYPCEEYCEDNVAIGKATLCGEGGHLRSVAIGSGSQGYWNGAGSEDCVSVGCNSSKAMVDRSQRAKKTTAIGAEAGHYLSNRNTYVGYASGTASKGYNNVMIGAENGCNESYQSINDVVILGNDIRAKKNGQMILGSTSQTEMVVLGNKLLHFNEDGSVTWETISL